jgi:hypothetical protein
MRIRCIAIGIILAFCACSALLAQECGSNLLPPAGHAFGEGESLCFSSEAPDGTDIGLLRLQGSGGQQAKMLFLPFYPDLDNGLCLPRIFFPWDRPEEFVIGYSEVWNGCITPQPYSLATSAVPAPNRILLSEVSFRRIGKRYYLRIVAQRLSDDASCISVSLGGIPLTISRYDHSGSSTTIESPLGKEKDLIRLGSGPPSLQLEDACTGSTFYSPPIPPGKEVQTGSHLSRSNSKVLSVGLTFIPSSGCEVIFYCWWSRAKGRWNLVNLPTYLDYDEAWGSEGHLPPSQRRIWKPGLMVYRLYDYCTGEFVGVSIPTGGS